ncbi:MAG: M15 family metallopeptidase [Candidatus Bipolaricaulota bacterium]|nr:M15 family metallopeptidase [Candidatus Bipolaricaulota bacterium]MCS7273878.1 M15 family metallopeptidase [Candidatus Bipolaricaulota bacterium]MDW8110704.1 M15 family metallopeptidase [Candidatus Bipolaricaulota bacterium]MDW8328438.1 M15 family metallopeptidase [Candidatus Bipolaricaulota bacterium]
MVRRNSIVEPISELNKIKIRDNGEPLVRLNGRSRRIVVLPNWRTGEPQELFVRQTVAQMLERAASFLPKGYKLGVFSAYRSVAEQEKIYRRVYRRFKRRYPHAPKNVLRRMTNRFVHPPDIKTPPGHSTGGAVDVTILNSKGQELDMTSPFKWRTPKARAVAATYAKGLSEEARKNRALLIEAMTKAGFTNYAGEWWHWSYGDSCWAWRLGRKVAIYGLAQEPKR